MRTELKRESSFSLLSWINDKPISTADWDVFVNSDGETQITIVAQEPNTNNQLRITLNKHHNYEDVKEQGNSGNQTSEEPRSGSDAEEGI